MSEKMTHLDANSVKHMGLKVDCPVCVPALPAGVNPNCEFGREDCDNSDCRPAPTILTEAEMNAGAFVTKDSILSLDADRWSTKDSGERIVYDSGMVRDVQTGKARFDLLIPEGVPYEDQYLTRVAQLMARGAEKYGERNWEKATDDVELGRAKASALRHFMQWLTGELDEDHAAAVFFNINEVETIKFKQRSRASNVTTEVDA